jgi:hypothetical protein
MSMWGVRRGFIENPAQLLVYGAATVALAVYIYACICEG